MSARVIVVGAGADALAAAHLLARGGREVLVLEETVARSYDAGWVPPALIAKLGIRLNVETPDPWATVLLPEGGALELWRDMQRTVASIRKLSPRDAAKWPDFCRRMALLARLLEELYVEAPVDPRALKLAFRVRRLGRQAMEDLMRILPMSVAELLDDWFECDALKGALGAMGVLHLQQGPRSGGTAFRLLHHHAGCAEGVFRPPRSNLGAVLRQRRGVQIRSGKAIKILSDTGRVRGVVLEGGEEIATDLVVSAADPRRTLLELSNPAWLDPELARALSNVRTRGVAARLSFKGVSTSNWVMAPSLDYLEKAYDEAKYARVSRAPYLEAYPVAGGVEVHYQYVPHGVGADLADTARRLLPGLDDAQAQEALPADLERREGWPGGQAYHAELTLDQALWMRPLPELAGYRTPIEGLWLCGPAMHPGGGLAGAAGYNCAHEISRRQD